MIDHQARQEIRSAVDDFLDGKITAFALDERLYAIETADSTAREVIYFLWHTYDDLKDHGPEHWGKPVWDLVQRLLLILDSESQLIVTKGRWIWRWSQVVALGGLALISILYSSIYDYWLFPVLIGAVVSMAIAWWRDRQQRALDEGDLDSVTPFASASEIQSVLRQMPGWRKRRHPGGEARRLRSRSIEWVYRLQWRLLCCVFSPLALALQALPQRESCTFMIKHSE